jgi:hypothetical protein
MPIENAFLHLLSAVVVSVVGGGVVLWALLSRPRVRWDRFWIGLALLLVAPVAFIMALAWMADAWEAASRLDSELAGEAFEDTTVASRVGGPPIVVDSATYNPLGAPLTTGDGTPSPAAHQDQTGR